VTTAPSVLLWDQSEDPPTPFGTILCWRSYADGDGIASVPAYLEAHAERIRSKYLSFIHELGQTVVAGRRVVDHLDVGDGFSFWWMTTLAEKSPLKSPRIYDCLRLLALEEMLTGIWAATVTLVSADESLARAVQVTCQNLSTGFSWRRQGQADRRWSLRKVYEALPYALKGLLSLRHVIMRWPLREARNPPWFAGENATFICSYFIHLDPSLCARGRFRSGQWESLPDVLRTSDWRINWLQLFLFSAAVPRIESALSWVRLFNADSRNQGCHAFLDSYLTFSLVLKAVRTWLWLGSVGRRLKGIPAAFCPRASAVWLWPFLQDDWWASLGGQIGMGNCFALAQFDAALAQLPRQATGLYLCENQAWEKALLWFWRKHGHGKIIGVQHATAPFWHLYYFDDPRSLNPQAKCALPLPDQLAVNGAAVWTAFLAAGYPESRLVKVEALRYLALAGLAATRQSSLSVPEQSAAAASSRPAIKVLILGDLIPKSMRHLLGLMQGAMTLAGSGYELTLKPHPGYSPDLAEYPGLDLAVTCEPLAQIVAFYDLAVAANSTSAAVDAYVAGLPVIIGLDGDNLNLSPLRGQTGVRFVSSRADLADSLRAAGGERVAEDRNRGEFFFLDQDLRRWKKLMQETWTVPI
jgi:surface carbohydrate biosynthesis protein (TIGR04326 family)